MTAAAPQANPAFALVASLLDDASSRMDAAGIPKAPAPCRLVPCPYCGASGYAPYHSRGSEREEKCVQCAGSGQMLTERGEP